jgi:Zn-dependent protease
MAIVAALLFFGSLLLHELGHALQARREHVEIEDVTLWLFGGVARFRGMFPTAGAEFRIAIAGPLVSLALGTAFVLVAALTGSSEAVDGVAAWLGYINFALLLFNLLPALPLDGGRVLRAALWRARGDFVWATNVAAAMGRAFGIGLVATGLLLFITAGVFSGVWLTFVGWFLLGAASSEARYVAMRDALAGLRVGDVMTRYPVTAQADETIGRFVDDIAGQAHHHAYPVLRGDEVVGLLPFARVARTPRAEWDVRHVAECMLPRADVAVLAPEEPAFDALVGLAGVEVHRALVLQDGQLVGVLSISDLARTLGAGGPTVRPAAPGAA